MEDVDIEILFMSEEEAEEYFEKHFEENHRKWIEEFGPEYEQWVAEGYKEKLNVYTGTNKTA